MAEFVRQVRNPYCFRVGKIAVSVWFSQDGVAFRKSAWTRRKFYGKLKSRPHGRVDPVARTFGKAPEAQARIHYAMPVRNNLYDALEYAGQ